MRTDLHGQFASMDGKGKKAKCFVFSHGHKSYIMNNKGFGSKMTLPKVVHSSSDGGSDIPLLPMPEWPSDHVSENLRGCKNFALNIECFIPVHNVAKPALLL